MKTNILIIDDESAIREMVCLALQQNGFACLEAADAHKAEVRIRETCPDLILLDWMMPGMSGIDLVRRLRRQQQTRDIPIIMLTARVEEDNVIQALSLGADDYITKPFSTRELIARIQSLLRRTVSAGATQLLRYKRLSMDLKAFRVLVDAQAIEIGPTEFKLLRFFMENPNQVFSRQQVLNNVWGTNVYVEERTVDVHIRRLRKTLAATATDSYVQTVRGAGYRFS